MAVDAAFQAAKEAVHEQTTESSLSIAKSETATNEQLKQLNVTLTTALKGVDRTIGDLKDRISRYEAMHAAQQGKGAGMQQSWAILIAAIGGLAGIVGIIVALLAMFAK